MYQPAVQQQAYQHASYQPVQVQGVQQPPVQPMGVYGANQLAVLPAQHAGAQMAGAQPDPVQSHLPGPQPGLPVAAFAGDHVGAADTDAH